MNLPKRRTIENTPFTFYLALYTYFSKVNLHKTVNPNLRKTKSAFTIEQFSNSNSEESLYFMYKYAYTNPTLKNLHS